MSAVLDRVDRNGTKYFHEVCKCDKCGGTGFIPFYVQIYAGVCFDCDGKGVIRREWKEYTPEYEAKLEQKRLKKALATAEADNQKFLRRMGFSEDGFAWLVLGETYSIKDELKSAGARYDRLFGWHFDHEVAEYSCLRIDIKDYAQVNEFGRYWFQDDLDVIDKINSEKETNTPKSQDSEVKKSNYIGDVGETIEVSAEYVNCFSYETHFTYQGEIHHIHKFSDKDGNIIIWNTSSCQDLEKGNTYTITGKVKEHSTYKGEMQTVLSRCRIK